MSRWLDPAMIRKKSKQGKGILQHVWRLPGQSSIKPLDSSASDSIADDVVTIGVGRKVRHVVEVSMTAELVVADASFPFSNGTRSHNRDIVVMFVTGTIDTSRPRRRRFCIFEMHRC